jgi:hypothetical protein
VPVTVGLEDEPYRLTEMLPTRFSEEPLTLSDDIRCRAPIDYILVERAYESRKLAAPKILADSLPIQLLHERFFVKEVAPSSSFAVLGFGWLGEWRA